MCYVGRLKGSMYLVNARLVVRNAAKTLQIRGWKGKGGATWGPNPWGGWRDGGREHIYLHGLNFVQSNVCSADRRIWSSKGIQQ